TTHSRVAFIDYTLKVLTCRVYGARDKARAKDRLCVRHHQLTPLVKDGIEILDLRAERARQRDHEQRSLKAIGAPLAPRAGHPLLTLVVVARADARDAVLDHFIYVLRATKTALPAADQGLA